MQLSYSNLMTEELCNSLYVGSADGEGIEFQDAEVGIAFGAAVGATSIAVGVVVADAHGAYICIADD